MVDKVGGVEFDVRVDETGAVSSNQRLIRSNDRLEDSFQDVDTASKRTGATLTKQGAASSTALQGMSRSAGQVGIQFQQLVGQIQGGQNAFQALSSQAADIGIVMGAPLVGAVAGLSAALVGSLVPSLFETEEASTELRDALRELRKEKQLTANESAFLAGEEGRERQERQENIDSIRDQIRELEALQERRQQAARSGGRRGRAARSEGARERIQETETELQRLRAELDGLLVEQGEIARTAANDVAREAQRGVQLRLEALQRGLNAEGEILANANQRRADIEAFGVTESLARFDEQQANRIARLEAAFQQEQALLQVQREQNLANEDLTRIQRIENERQYEALELQALQQFENEKTNIEQQGARARAQIQETENHARLNSVRSVFGNISSLMNTESRKLFEIGKTAALSNAVVNTYQGITNALADVRPVPLNYAAAAAVAAQGFAQVRQIQSTQFGSAGTGQSIQGGQVVNNVTSGGQGQQAQRNVSIAITGDNFGAGGIRSLIAEINEEIGDGVNLFTEG